MADDDLGGLFALEEAERILLNEAHRPKPPADDEAEVFAHWYPYPSGAIWCERCEQFAERCVCWADMMARRAVAEDLRADVDPANDWCRTQPGCCSTCGGKGDIDGLWGGPCSDCYGTGHLHLGPCTLTPEAPRG